ncbi:MAG: hypothetical protein CM1200mP18_20280 [Gammaproteobacteria bacterium]|nr:MAG: hypothetical protein CM1200mP18_20280 [Gammaproteobacteria bacterium]
MARGWHPERIPQRSDDHVLVVGAGRARLEAARAFGPRGYDVMLAEPPQTWVGGYRETTFSRASNPGPGQGLAGLGRSKRCPM